MSMQNLLAIKLHESRGPINLELKVSAITFGPLDTELLAENGPVSTGLSIGLARQVTVLDISTFNYLKA